MKRLGISLCPNWMSHSDRIVEQIYEDEMNYCNFSTFLLRFPTHLPHKMGLFYASEVDNSVTLRILTTDVMGAPNTN